MIVEEERDERLAMARRLPTAANVQLPDQPADAPTYVRTGTTTANNEQPAVSGSTTAVADSKPVSDGLNLKPIDSGVRTLEIKETSDTSPSKPADPIVEPAKVPEPEAKPAATDPEKAALSTPTVELQLPVSMPELKAGEKAKIAVMVSSSAAFRSAVLGLRFDQAKLAVRSVSFGDIFGTALATRTATPFLNQNGKMFVLLSMPDGNVATTTGILAFVEIEALTDGKVDLSLEKDAMNFLAADGKNFALKF